MNVGGYLQLAGLVFGVIQLLAPEIKKAGEKILADPKVQADLATISSSIAGLFKKQEIDYEKLAAAIVAAQQK